MVKLASYIYQLGHIVLEIFKYDFQPRTDPSEYLIFNKTNINKQNNNFLNPFLNNI